MLTTADVEQKTFSTALRGYDLDEVDDFLDEVVATIRSLTEELEVARSARGDSPAVVPAPAPVPEPEPELEPEPGLESVSEPEPAVETPRPEIDEGAIGRALIAAQTAADKLLEDAKGEADKIVDGAKSEADSWTAEREAKRREAEAEIAALAARVSSVRSELSVLADEVAEKLDDMDAAIEGSAETDTGFGAGPSDHDDAVDAEAVIVAIDDESHEEISSVDVDDDDGDDDGDDRSGFGSADGTDHLDEILTGVATDLQLGSDGNDDGSNDDDERDPADEDE